MKSNNWTKELIAIHEAGHIEVAIKRKFKLKGSYVYSESGKTEGTKSYYVPNEIIRSIDDILKPKILIELAVIQGYHDFFENCNEQQKDAVDLCLGGWAAECAFHKTSLFYSGSKDDIKKACQALGHGECGDAVMSYISSTYWKPGSSMFSWYIDPIAHVFYEDYKKRNLYTTTWGDIGNKPIRSLGDFLISRKNIIQRECFGRPVQRAVTKIVARELMQRGQLSGDEIYEEREKAEKSLGYKITSYQEKGSKLYDELLYSKVGTLIRDSRKKANDFIISFLNSLNNLLK